MDVKAHLLSRSLNPDFYNVSWDDETASFALWNLSGQWAGYQQYRPFASKSVPNDPKLGRYYTYLKDKTAVWGMETYHWRTDVLFFTEGVFDACKLHLLGLPAVAVLSNDPKKLRPWVSCLPRHTVSVCDDDKAGHKLAKLCDRGLVCPNGLDLGDMPLWMVVQFLNDNMPGLLK